MDINYILLILESVFDYIIKLWIFCLKEKLYIFNEMMCFYGQDLVFKEIILRINYGLE